ncbi:MAG: hypothetical protein HY290_31745 [Planctomycetia bacterium]|nr:hypothetical protein [Planctomycetia bacterium]
MAWKKLGLIFAPAGEHPWMVSHASNPTPEPRGDDVIRVYFGCRDASNRAHIAWVDLEMGNAPRVIRIADEPVVAPGPQGGFDDSGTSMGCLVQDGDRTLLYYLGWNLGVTVPWRNSIGLAIRERPDGPFVKYSPAPLLDRATCDPYTLSYPFVARDNEGWRMWYGSNLAWGSHEKDMHHVIKYARSRDGIHWERTGEVALGLEGGDEIAVCRPWVEDRGSSQRLWYCHRGAAYRLGLAESRDGRTWNRVPLPKELDVSPTGWDSEMLAYPARLDHRGRQYLFYNGNGYGKTGFGVAVADAA